MGKRFAVLLAACIGLLTSAGPAQDDFPLLPLPRLLGLSGEDEQPLQLIWVDVKVRICGGLSETRMTLSFFNPNSRALAGDFTFPLPEGATVSGYALDVNGVMVDGVAVAKDKARLVFEKEMRRRVDPGLVEWVGGSSFRTRIFPIPAYSSRTVMVRYLSEPIERSGETFYHLPFRFPDRIDDFFLRVEADGPEAPRRIRGGKDLHFIQGEKGYVAETRLNKASVSEDILMMLPGLPKQTVQIEKTVDGECYFMITDHPDQAQAGEQAGKDPEKMCILWDASASRAAADHEREYELIRRYLERLEARIVTVDLVCVRFEAEPARMFVISGGNCEDLIAALRQVAYDGGTRFSAFSRRAGGPEYDLYLMFSDGVANFAENEPGPFHSPLYTFSASNQADHPCLKHLALKNGGEYFNLKRSEPGETAAKIGRPPFCLISVSTDAAKSIEIAGSCPVSVSGPVCLAGKLLAPSCRIFLNYGRAGRIEQSSVFALSSEEAVAGDLLPAYWAQKKINELLADAKRNHNALCEIGKRFGLVTPGTSLLVLENLQQYVEHEVVPPSSLPAMCAKYFEWMKSKQREIRRGREEKIDWLVRLWQDRVEWWKKEFRYPKNLNYREYLNRPQYVFFEDDSRERQKDSETIVLDNGFISGGIAGGVEGGVAGSVPSDVEPSPVVQPQVPAIVIQEWDPKTPYLRELKKVQGDAACRLYLALRTRYAASPAFFLDCAEFFFRRGLKRWGLQALSNLAELELEDHSLLRIMGRRLRQLGYLREAAACFSEVLRLRPEEPQSWLDLAVAQADLGRYLQAIRLLRQVLMGEWDRFEEIEAIALMDLNRIIPLAKKAGIRRIPIDAQLVKLLDVDIRIVMSWDSDQTDIDLWVTEPSGEKVFYNHDWSFIGGRLSRDFTDGYGPEEYMVKKAMPGVYRIEANYFGNSAPQLTGPVTVQVDIYTRFGRPDQEKKSITLRLTGTKETYELGQVDFK